MELGRGEGSRTKGGALILLESLHEKQAGSPKATQQSPYLAACIIAYREGKDDSKSRVSTNTKRGIQRGEARGRNHYFGDAKAVRCRNCQIGSSRTGTPTPRSGGYKYQESRI
jgi:hypothetical protein